MRIVVDLNRELESTQTKLTAAINAATLADRTAAETPRTRSSA